MNDLPQDFGHALAGARLTEFFDECTGAHRREYLKWIGEAKRPETRKARIAQAVRRLAEKRIEEEAKARKKARAAAN